MSSWAFRRWGPVLLAIALCILAVPARAAITPESDVLLPWFGVDLNRDDEGMATRFNVISASAKPVDVSVTVYTNWGIPVLEVPMTFKRAEAKTILLHEWIRHGKLPDRTLSAAELADLQAKLTGRPSPADGLYYGSPFTGTSPNADVGTNVATGYVIVRTLGDRPDVLWGDTHTIDLVKNYFEAETLTALTHSLKSDCSRHGIRFDNEGVLFEGDELFVWSGRRFSPSVSPTPIGDPMKMWVRVYDQQGNHVHTCYRELIAVEPVMLCNDVDIPIGWLEVITEDPTFILAHLHSALKSAAELHSYCLRQDLNLQGAGITLKKKIDGDDADNLPGPLYAQGTPIEFEYEVTNSGTEPLTGITVEDDVLGEITCPKTALEPAETMVCLAQSVAQACINVNTGTATGTAPNNTRVSASDRAVYEGAYKPDVSLELLVNDDPADEPKGPIVKAGDTLYWTFVVTNSGDATLSNVVVELRKNDVVVCPKSELAAGESMTCTGLTSLAEQGQRHETALVTASDPCGKSVTASDPAYYFGRRDEPGIELKKYVDNQDADVPPGPHFPAGTTITWQFIVTNVGDVTLTDVTVNDSDFVVTCPGTTLEPGESMTCTTSGVAVACQNANTAHAQAKAGERTVNASDSAHYFGDIRPAIALELKINGDPADTPLGPTIPAGATINLTYEVTNTGDATLSNIVVGDDSDQTATCPKTTLAPAEMMICTATTIALKGSRELYGTATGTPPCGENVSATDPAFYLGQPQEPSIDILKMTNGVHVNAPPGPTVPAGSKIIWTYLVTNNGTVPLTGITVTDSGEIAVTCPKTALDPGESMTCTAEGIAQACQYTNLATATGTGAEQTVSSMDDSFYYGEPNASISVEKRTNGQDYPSAPGLLITTGTAITWTYIVTNTGDVQLTGAGVMDDRAGAATCPKTTLDPGESMTCTAGGNALAGQQSNIATASGTPPCGSIVRGTATNYYYGVTPRISLEKLINGEDADDSAHAVHVMAGASLLWTFVVTNTGDVTLSDIAITDDKVVNITCPATTLAAGASMTCVAEARADPGLDCNLGSVSGTSPQAAIVTATDTACYYGDSGAITIEKRTNGFDADTPPGPQVEVGSSVTWTYIVTNTGEVTLTGVAVTDNMGVTVTCPKTSLAAGESMTCTAAGTAITGQYANIGTATGNPPTGPAVTATDPSHYLGVVTGNQGCTPGYWKNHTDSWPPTGFSPTQTVGSVFPESNRYALHTASLVGALSFSGGAGTGGAAEILLRAAVAATLNAAHPGVAYPRSPASVISDTSIALATEDRDTMLALAAQLDADNNLGCPLN